MLMTKRRICVLTGTRAEYGLLKPVLDAVWAHEGLELILVVTGMHLSEKFGLSVKEIERDGYTIAARVPMDPPEDTGKGMALAVAQGIKGLTEAFAELVPQVLVLLGDRTEVLAGATAALFLGIPIAHIHGGDVTRGGTDESVRHAVTKMASIHFPATPKSAARIQKMGEDPWRIHLTGAPGLDTILSFQPLSPQEIHDRYGLAPQAPYAMLVYHAVSTEPERAGQDMATILETMKELGMPTVAIYPNSDAGGQKIIEVLQAHRAESWLKIHASLPHQHYLSLLKSCKVLVGNSSSGIIESSSFKIPVVNIGMRQEGRERGDNVIDTPMEKPALQKALQTALSDDFQKTLPHVQNPYGGGRTGEAIAEILGRIDLGKELIQKKLNLS